MEVDDRGFIRVDKQLRTNVPHIFAIGDIVGQPMLAHKGVHEGHVAAEVIAGKKHYFDPKVIPSIAYTEPEVAWVGLTEKEAKEKGISYETATFPWAASGRAIASDCADGMTKLIFDKESHRVIGGAIVGTNGGELLGEIGLAIEMGCDAEDIALTIHAHPTLHESVGLAAEVFEGSITDLPNPKAKKKYFSFAGTSGKLRSGYSGRFIVDKVLVVDAGCGVNALSDLQNHANSIYCMACVGPISLRIGRFDVCHQS